MRIQVKRKKVTSFLELHFYTESGLERSLSFVHVYEVINRLVVFHFVFHYFLDLILWILAELRDQIIIEICIGVVY